MIGYKGFDKDFKCRGFQYEVGKTYELEGELKLCENGFHFCTRPLDVLLYYPNILGYYSRHIIQSFSRYALIEALGDVVFSDDPGSNKCATNKIRIIREASIEELYRKERENPSIFYDDVLAWEGKA